MAGEYLREGDRVNARVVFVPNRAIYQHIAPLGPALRSSSPKNLNVDSAAHGLRFGRRQTRPTLVREDRQREACQQHQHQRDHRPYDQRE